MESHLGKALLLLFFVIFSYTSAVDNSYKEEKVPSAPLLNNGAAVDEVIVESSLYIKPKQQPGKKVIRRVRDTLLRLKRSPQFRRGGGQRQQLQPGEYEQSQAVSNAAANNYYQNPFGGFGISAGNAQAQAFNSKGAAGSFGASSAGSLTQATNSDRFGFQNSAGASHSQTFNLPNGQSINFASTNSFANGPGGNNANSRGGAVSVSQG